MSDSSSLDPGVLSTVSEHRADDGCMLFARQWTSREAAAGSGALVVLLHGYWEHSGRYREFAEFLVRAGHPVFAFDARGHGRSPGQRGHIDSYRRYVDDLYGYSNTIRQQQPTRPLIVLGHSNGGLTALRMVQTRPAVADGLILSSPLIGLRPAHTPMPRPAAALVAKVIKRLPLPRRLNPNELTHDAAIATAHRADPLNHGWTSAVWYMNMIDAIAEARAHLDAVRLPVLVLEGDADPIVVPDEIKRLYEALPSPDKQLIVCNDAYHELLNEVGRELTYQRIGDWLAEHGRAGIAA